MSVSVFLHLKKVVDFGSLGFKCLKSRFVFGIKSNNMTIDCNERISYK